MNDRSSYPFGPMPVETAARMKLLPNAVYHLALPEKTGAKGFGCSPFGELTERATRRTRVLEEILAQSEG